jgi:TolB-like protein/Tfp pilus assembly protein PilF
MSPEQVRGEELDTRTDLFSFGAVLYEMVTGRQAFAGATSGVVFHAILDRMPVSPVRLNPELPVRVEEVINRALEKDRRLRYQTAADLRAELQRLKRDSSSTGFQPVAPGSAAVSAAGGTGFQPVAHSLEGCATAFPGRTRRAVAVAAAVAVVLGAALGWYLLSGRSRGIDSIAVLPFVNVAADPNTEYLSDGIAESLTNTLSQLPGLRVRSRSSAFRYKGKEVDIPKAGKELGVRALVTGRVTRRGDDLLISVELVDTQQNEQIWGEQYARKLADTQAVQGEIAKEISEKLRLRLTGEQKQRLVRAQTASSEAYQLYLQGRYHWNKRTEEGFKKSIEYFNQAIAKDPGYALAYAGLADSYWQIGDKGLAAPKDTFPKARAFAAKALEMDAGLAEPHATLGAIKNKYDRDWAGAEQEFKRAIELNPNCATAHHWYAYYLGWAGRHTEAARAIKRAQEADPLSLPIQITPAYLFCFTRQYGQAAEQFLKVLDLDPNFAGAHNGLGWVHLQNGRFQAAIEEFQKALALSGNALYYIPSLGYGYARAGKKADALRLVEELKELRRRRYVDAAGIGWIYTGLADKDHAFAWFDRALEEGSPNLVDLKVEPGWDPLRSDPRFADLLRRVGIP